VVFQEVVRTPAEPQVAVHTRVEFQEAVRTREELQDVVHIAEAATEVAHIPEAARIAAAATEVVRIPEAAHTAAAAPEAGPQEAVHIAAGLESAPQALPVVQNQLLFPGLPASILRRILHRNWYKTPHHLLPRCRNLYRT